MTQDKFTVAATGLLSSNGACLGVSTTILLVGIFFWLMVGDGVSHCRSFLKSRGTKSERMKKQFEKATKEQQKLTAQLGTSAILDSGTVHASNAATPAFFLLYGVFLLYGDNLKNDNVA